MSRFDAFAQKLQVVLSGCRLSSSDRISYNPIQSAVLARIQSSLSQFAGELRGLIDEERAARFFWGTMPDGFPMEGHFVGFICNFVPRSCSTTASGEIVFDKESAIQELELFEEAVKSNTLPYTMMFRIANIDIDAEIQIDEHLILHKIDPQTIGVKYPVLDLFGPLPTHVAESWFDHCVEAVFHDVGVPNEVKTASTSHDYTEAAVNHIQHAFLISNFKGKLPIVTHVNFSTILEGYSAFRGVGGFARNPRKLSDDEIDAFKRAYSLLNNASNDPILATAIERFILGRYRGESYPTRLNDPNWDKVIDYVIAMESIFTTVNKSPPHQEVGYRFRVNGASLLSKIDDRDVISISDSLNDLYSLRSIIVHGGSIKKIEKLAESFVDQLNIQHSDRPSPKELLQLVCRQLEDWIATLFVIGYRFRSFLSVAMGC